MEVTQGKLFLDVLLGVRKNNFILATPMESSPKMMADFLVFVYWMTGATSCMRSPPIRLKYCVIYFLKCIKERISSYRNPSVKVDRSQIRDFEYYFEIGPLTCLYIRQTCGLLFRYISKFYCILCQHVFTPKSEQKVSQTVHSEKSYK